LEEESSMGRRVTVSVIGLGVLLVLAGLLSLAASAASTEGKDTGPQPAGGYALVELMDKPVSSYDGGIPGYAPTKPAPGHKLDLASRPVADYRALLGSERGTFRAWLRSNAPQVEIVREYDLVFNGVAVKLNGASMSALARAPGVSRVTASWLYRPSMDVSVPLIQADKVWADLGVMPLADEPTYVNLPSIKVGVIDTGILDTHPFIASCRAEGSIQHNVFFSGTGTAMFGRTIVFDHGTHVAGTIGGCPVRGPFLVDGTDLTLHGAFGNNLTGVAPGVTLHDYNVFPGYGAGFIAFGGSAFSHDIIAAVEKAVFDGMDVINLSLGGGVQGPHDTLAEAINAAVDAGTIAVVAAGNSGPGIETVESPGNAAKAITAGASTNPHFMGISVRIGGFAFRAALGDFNNFVPALTLPWTNTTPANGCTAIAQDLTGKIAVIDRGVCTFGTKIRNAQAAHASGVLIVNNVAGDPIAMGMDSGPFPTIPAAMLSKADGTLLRGRPDEMVTVDGTDIGEAITANSDIIAGFSSRGPTPYDFRIKPDVTAPGVNVLSSVFRVNATTGAYEPEYAFFQGTSMATPHTTGAVALLLAAHDGWSPEQVKSALVNNADRPVWDSATGTKDTSPLTRGGGRINVARASSASIFLDPASVSFGLWTGGTDATASMAVSLMNTGMSTVTCGLAIDVAFPLAGAPVSVSPDTVAIPSGGTATVTVTLSGGKALGSGQYYGDVRATCDGATLLAPWWTAVQRTSGSLHGNQMSPSSGMNRLLANIGPQFLAGDWRS